MSLSEALLPEFDQEMASTRKTLERVPEDKFDWKPHEKINAARRSRHAPRPTAELGRSLP